MKSKNGVNTTKKRNGNKSFKHSVLLVVLLTIFIAIIYTSVRLGPPLAKSYHIKKLSNEEVLEVVKDYDDEQMADMLNSLTKTQAKRVFMIKVAYDIAKMEQEDLFDLELLDCYED